MPRNALIIGMPRSGTSLTAAVLARKGYYVGGSRLSAFQHGDDHNPFGYFEADDVVERNVEIFRRVGFPFQNTWRFDPLSSEQARAIRDLAPTEADRELVAAYDARAPWLWKDQRLCFTLPYWWKLLDPRTTRVLVVRRKPRHIYESFVRMGWCARDEEQERRVERLVEQHLGAAGAALDALSIPHIEVDYADYASAPGRVARHIGQFLEVELTGADLNVRPELDHTRPRGAVSARLRTLIKRLPRGPVRQAERLLPRWVVTLLFPERRYVQSLPPGDAVTTERLALDDAAGAAERELAAKLGRDPVDVALAARRTWGRSLSIELQHRAEGDQPIAAPQGEIEREQLMAALARELSLSLKRSPRERM